MNYHEHNSAVTDFPPFTYIFRGNMLLSSLLIPYCSDQIDICTLSFGMFQNALIAGHRSGIGGVFE